MPSLSVRSAFWHTLRILVYAKLCIKARQFLAKNYKSLHGSKLVVALALLLGAIVYQVIQKIIDKVLQLFMPLTELTVFDELFLYDPDSPANAAMLFRFEKHDPQKMIDFTRNVFAKRLSKIRVRLIQIFGKYYWIQMSEEEFFRKFDKWKIVHDDIRTMEQLQDFLTEELNQKLDLYNDIPWRMHIFNQCSDKYTHVLFMAHHSLSDGVSFLSALRTLSQNQPKHVMTVAGVPAWKQALGKIISPLYAMKRSVDQLLLPFDDNCFMNKPKPKLDQRKRCVLIGEECNRTQFGKSCKLYKCSSVEAAHAILGKSISEYIAMIGEKQIKQCTYASTFSLQPYARNPEEVKIGNYFVGMLLQLRTSSDFKKNLKASQAQARQMIGSMELLGQQTLFQYLFMLPYNLAQLPVDLICSKRTMQFSSAPAPKEGFNFNGIQSDGFYGFVPFMGDSTWGLVFASCDDAVLPALICDKYFMEHPDKFMEIFNRNVREFAQQSQTLAIGSNKVANQISNENDQRKPLTVSKL